MQDFKNSLLLRLTIVSRHISQSTVACLIAMTKGDLSTLTLNHWKVALLTGLGAGLISLIASYGNLVKFQTSRFGLAITAFIGTTIADYASHAPGWTESLLTGLGAAILSLLLSFTPLDSLLAKLDKE
ncbi:hypothetical protein ACNVED_00540 [Legionella sp. D16C41]|uniref:hypothetical protein n=1 Tax=Legionella sp. D16C41 TaxID=3402688 RepID=UPI003AF5D6BD